MILNAQYGPQSLIEPRADDIEGVYGTEREWRMEGKMDERFPSQAAQRRSVEQWERLEAERAAASPQPPDDIKALVEELRRRANSIAEYRDDIEPTSILERRAADALERQAKLLAIIENLDPAVVEAAERAASPTPPSEGDTK